MNHARNGGRNVVLVHVCQQASKLVAGHHSCLVEPVPALAAVCGDDGKHGFGELAGVSALGQLCTTTSERT